MHNFPVTPFFWIVLLSVLIGGFFSYTSGKLTFPASLTGVIAALLLYAGSGLSGLLMLAVFFILGTAVTSFRKEFKQKMGLAEMRDGKRTTGQVLANAGVAAILSLFMLFMHSHLQILQVMVAASLASATADTLSSELGNVYGRRFYNISTLQRDERGLNGVISVEGTLFGLAGSIVIAIVDVLVAGWSYIFFVIVVAGMAGNLFDSLIGAVFERRGYLGNDAVNFLNTAFAAAVALALMQ